MKRCMIVDASDVIRKVAKRILESEEMLVAEVASGRQALDLCANDMPDIILVDCKLPDMAVVDFVRMVGANEKKSQVIVCLTKLDIGAIMRAKRAGAQGYLLKPFNRSQLMQCLRHSFYATRARSAL
ncbi:response regulator [Tianweitania populi]|nr:response regulator [Tianweitania populi]